MIISLIDIFTDGIRSIFAIFIFALSFIPSYFVFNKISYFRNYDTTENVSLLKKIEIIIVIITLFVILPIILLLIIGRIIDPTGIIMESLPRSDGEDFY
jgi:hypothetical protein